MIWYVRLGHGPRIRIRAAYGTPEFDTEYQAALAGETKPKAGKASAASLRWLADQYRQTQAWSRLSFGTRRARENILRNALETAGGEPYREITRKTILAGIDRRKETPFAATNFLKTMRGLFQWAESASHVDIDPTAGIKASNPKTDGFEPWTEEDIARAEAAWPIGTRKRLALDLVLYTGLRRGDLVKLGKQHRRDGCFEIKTEKTGEWVTVPVLPPLAASIDATPTGDLAYLASETTGRPLAKESFGNMFSEWCREIGIDKTLHGIRKAAATRMAEAGATEAELEAVFGWRGGAMASLYTRSANRKRLAKRAAKLLDRPADDANVA